MPRYIDLDKAIKDVESVSAYWSEAEEVKEQCLIELEGQTIADVVPISEVEKAKQEVAREIFEEASKRFEVLLKDYPCEGDLVSAKKFLDFHWKPIVRSIMSDYMPNSKRNT